MGKGADEIVDWLMVNCGEKEREGMIAALKEHFVLGALRLRLEGKTRIQKVGGQGWTGGEKQRITSNGM